MSAQVKKLDCRIELVPKNPSSQSVSLRQTTVAQKICRSVGDVFAAMGYLAFKLGLVGLAVLGVFVTGGALSNAFLTAPAYMAIGGAASCLAGAILQGMGSREVTDLNFSQVI